MKWLVCECWTLFILSLETDWETTNLGHQVELEWRLKVFPRTSDLWFWIPPHQGTHSYSQILKLTYHTLSFSNEVDPFNFSLCTCNISNKMVSERSSFQICLTCFVSFGIRDNSFMLLEDYAFNFLHGYWNYVLIKTEIGVMMLFKFEFKYVKLIFKAIASMKFSFDIIL